MSKLYKIILMLLLSSVVTFDLSLSATNESTNLAQQLYVSYYGRPADPDGQSYWAEVFDETDDLTAALSDFGISEEYTNNFGSMTNEELVTNLYHQLFGRDPETEGLDFYTTRLSSGESTLATIAKQIADGASGDDLTTMNNKITVANTYTSAVSELGADYNFDNIAVAQAILDAVDATAASVTEGNAEATEEVASNVSSTTNHKPIASSISLNIDSSVPYLEQQLIGNDPDGDTITYELISDSSGDGYSQSYVNSTTGMLYINCEPNGNDSFTLSYHVTDGQLFSDPATVTVQVTYLSEDDKTTGNEEVGSEEYSGFDLSTYNSDLLGGDSEPVQPTSIDLSLNFPTPGDQGQQSSCVGWATAYALKSYQEGVEIGWSLNTSSHLFSPAFIYNQIVIGNDGGSYISDALDLAVNLGVSTLASMPYSHLDYTTQPSAAALEEASQYKAARWSRVNDTAQIKAALANRKPVVCGIAVYESLVNLYGDDSVYNTISGQNLGGHAVTIVGYDDNKFGGAFKIINSWSTNWGDDGFFWLPYSFASQGIMREAYVLEDVENGSIPDDTEQTESEPDYNTLPNLTVSSWHADYDPRPNGSGTLTYEVINNGSGTAPLGADINLMLSDNDNITSNDYYVVYEENPYDLLPGGSVYRDSDNALSFNFPDQIESGVYYMALWVDDLDEVEESNENDNISLSSSTITIENSMPDLSVNSWYAEWDGYGNGTLTYEIENSGVSAVNSTDWYINLVLDEDQNVGNGNEIFLFYEQAAFSLNPGAQIYRNSSNPAHFNLYVDYYGYSIPSGVYYMALWVDDLNAVDESNEFNNGSYSWDVVNVSSYYGTSDEDDKPLSYTETSGKAYNGKKLPSKDVLMKKVMITKSSSGEITMQILDEDSSKKTEDSRSEFHTKQISSSTGLIFPSSERIPMPNGMPTYEK